MARDSTSFNSVYYRLIIGIAKRAFEKFTFRLYAEACPDPFYYNHLHAGDGSAIYDTHLFTGKQDCRSMAE